MSIAAHFTIAQYDKMIAAGVFDDRHGRRIELFRGEIVEMSPIGDRHAAAVDRLTRLSIQALPAERAHVRIQGPIVLAEQESRPESDVLWLVPGKYGTAPVASDVLLLIEVADATWTYDTREKAQLYAEAGISDYWVVNLVDNYVVVFREPGPKGYRDAREYRGDEQIRPLAFPDLSLRAGEITR